MKWKPSKNFKQVSTSSSFHLLYNSLVKCKHLLYNINIKRKYEGSHAFKLPHSS